MEKQLEGKFVLVTGGGSGIGRASALAFAGQGAGVIIADLMIEGGEETVAMIEKGGGRAIFVQTDVSKALDVETMVEKAVKTFGRLDCAFNNAGILGERNLAADYTEEEWNKIIGINLTGTWLCMKYEILQMLKQNSGAIVNTASVLGLVGANGPAAAYAASKHGVVGLTKSAALTYAQSGIRINSVCPGFIKTPLIDPMIGGDPEIEAALNQRHPIGRMGKPEEVAEAVVWLCTDAASFVTGHSMSVDGGYVAE